LAVENAPLRISSQGGFAKNVKNEPEKAGTGVESRKTNQAQLDKTEYARGNPIYRRNNETRE
jgi:hypothetical protein